jgi:predicted RecA/RadA family phage recombinase
MSEALLEKDSDVIDVTTPTAGYSSGEVIQLADGRAAVVQGLSARVSGDKAGLKTSGQVRLAKTASVVILPGGRVYWDRSANTATPLQIAAGADFFVGVAPEGAASAATTVLVDLNAKPKYLTSLGEGGFDCVPVLTAGTLFVGDRGGEFTVACSATAEAQKGDLLSRKSVPVTVPMIFECIFQVVTTADADVADLSVGLANATHASDADSITESALFHADLGADLNLDAESDDGTTEVAATDTTVDLVAGTDIEVWLDARDLTNVKYYVNGVEVLSATANLGNIAAAAGPLKALFHLEKSANDTLCEVKCRHLAIRATDQAS